MKKEIVIALAGNANVGKSVIFNQLTGLNQIIGNWPGKTVERAEGLLKYRGQSIRIVDLPGIYSLSAYSQEEIVSMEFIAFEKPDVVINVVDASNLERNLYLTIQLLEMHVPMVMALNQMDHARKKGIEVDASMLSEALGIPVIETVGTRGKGLDELLNAALQTAKVGTPPTARGYDLYGEKVLKYRPDISKVADRICNILMDSGTALLKSYHPLWIALKLIEGDSYFDQTAKKDPSFAKVYERIRFEVQSLQSQYDMPLSTIVTSDRYKIASEVAKKAEKKIRGKIVFSDLIDNITLSNVWGYVILGIIIFASFYGIFRFGEYFSELLSDSFSGLKPYVYALNLPDLYKDFLWNGIIEGFISAVTIVLPYILPFYIFLAILENSGYLARIAFLMDKLMHKVGLHGKGLIPILMGFGCNVPAVLGAKIMETRREIFIASFMATLVPCSARLVIILGTIGVFMGPQYALAIFVLDALVVFSVGYLADKLVPGKTYDLIMEMPDYRVPALKPTLKQTWFRIKDFLNVALPIIVIGSLAMEILKYLDVFKYITRFTDPVIVNWLGLPSITGVVMIFGLLRKELTLIMLLAFSGAETIKEVLTWNQMIVFGVVTMLYIPCIATIAALKKTVGWLNTLLITSIEIFGAILLGGIINHILNLFV